MDGSDHRNHTVLVGVRRARDINYKAEFTIVARLATYRQVHKYTGMNVPLIGIMPVIEDQITALRRHNA
ncbi:MAG TPA: hypothetical protein VJ370_03850 [Streptosporangiaceae bacterium]|nr:hypothetical protein [Streptosporangiaceae bacterium]